MASSIASAKTPHTAPPGPSKPPNDATLLATLLQSLVPPSVWRAERLLLADQPTEQALRALLEFHQDTVAAVAATFANALPSEAALDAVVRQSPLGVVEIGAGQGLFAWLLRRRGLAVHAFDTATGGVPFDGCGAGVSSGGPAEAARHPECSLLLCWPPLEDEQGGDGPELMALEALRAYRGDVLLYVGEWRGAVGAISRLSWRTAVAGQTAGPRFQQEVERDWVLAEPPLPLPRWPGFADCLRVFRRRGAAPAGSSTRGTSTAPVATPAAAGAPAQLGRRLAAMERLGLGGHAAAIAAAVVVADAMGEIPRRKACTKVEVPGVRREPDR